MTQQSSTASSPLMQNWFTHILLALSLVLLLSSSQCPSAAEAFPLDAAEPSFAWPSRSSRAFVGIRTLHPSQAVFGVRQLKERLAEQAEQRREQRQAAAEQLVQSEQEQRRQRIYDRLMCMAALQNLAQCKDI